MFGEVKKELEETSVKHQKGCSSHLLAAGRLIKKIKKNLTQTRREDHFSCLIKQSVYDDSCQTDANTLRQKCDVKSLKWDFLAAKIRKDRGKVGVFSISGQEGQTMMSKILQKSVLWFPAAIQHVFGVSARLRPRPFGGASRLWRRQRKPIRGE